MKPTHLRLALALAICSFSAATLSTSGGASRSARSSASSSALTSASLGRRSASLRPCAWRMVRSRLIWLGEPAVVMPARRQVLTGVSFSVVRTRLGSARSSKKMSRTSSWVIVNSKSSSPSPLSDACLPRPPSSPERGFLISSPGANSLLPGSTKSRSPAERGSRREARLLGALGGDLDLALFADIGDGGVLQRFLHRLADLRARATQEALAVAEALALGVEAAVDEVGHGAAPPVIPGRATVRSDSVRTRCEGKGTQVGRPDPVHPPGSPSLTRTAFAFAGDDISATPPCSRACTTPRAGAPASGYSRASACA